MKQDPKPLEQLIAKTENICVGAVEYVGAANYAERERKAIQWVRSAFIRLQSAIKEVK